MSGNNGKLNEDIVRVYFKDGKMKVGWYGNPLHWAMAARLMSLDLDNKIIENQMKQDQPMVQVPKGIVPDNVLKKLI